jgi:ribosome recycling factor
MIDGLKKDVTARMTKAVDALKLELAKLRTGRAHPSLLDHITVNYYGNDVPLKQVANVSVSDARTLSVTPWEKNITAAIEKAIQLSDLGLTPSSSSGVIRVPLPSLTEQRRKDLVKVVKGEGEGARVAVRNVRRDANQELKNLLKDKKISEDEDRRAQDEIQKLTDKFVAEIDKLLQAKEAELLEV